MLRSRAASVVTESIGPPRRCSTPVAAPRECCARRPATTRLNSHAPPSSAWTSRSSDRSRRRRRTTTASRSDGRARRRCCAGSPYPVYALADSAVPIWTSRSHTAPTAWRCGAQPGKSQASSSDARIIGIRTIAADGNAIRLARPGAEIDHPAALGTERAVRIRRGPFDRGPASGAGD